MLPGPEPAIDTKEKEGRAEVGVCEDASRRAVPSENSLYFGTETRCVGVVVERALVIFGCLGVLIHATRACDGDGHKGSGRGRRGRMA